LECETPIFWNLTKILNRIIDRNSLAHMKHSLPVILFLIAPLLLLGQKETYNWTFGQFAGLSFHSGSPVPFLTSSNSHEGCASISDSSGQLLFYTNSESLWDRNHNRIDFLYGEDHATQSSLFVPWPGRDSLYYYFNAPSQNDDPFKYAVLNKNLNGGQGGFQTPVTTLFNGSTEKQAATQHANGRDFWLVTHSFPGDSFFVYLVDSTGLHTTPTVVEIGSSLRQGLDPVWGTVETTGQMKISPQGDKLALVFEYVDVNVGNIEIFDFDNQTGQISNYHIYSGLHSSIMGVEFSQNGQFLYVCEYGFRDTINPGRIYGFEIATNGSLQNQQLLYETDEVQLGQLQLAPNGYIYFSKYGQRSLGAITRPNVSLADAKLSVDEFSVFFNILAPGGYYANNPRFGLPNFISNFFKDPYIDFGVRASCIGDSAQFAAFSNVEVDSWTWTFGDISSGSANGAFVQRPKHLFVQNGIYTVSLIGYINGTPVDTVVKSIEILPHLAPNLSDTTLCSGETVLRAYPDTTLDYIWSTGDTTSYKLIDQPGLYYIIARNDLGCMERDTFEVKYTPNLNLDLGADTVICSPQTLILDAFSPSANRYLWNNGQKTSSIEVSSTGLYAVQVFSEGCHASDSIFVTVESSPIIDLGSDTTICEGQKIRLSPGLANSYHWSTGDTTSSIEVSSGLYHVRAISGNGCTSEDSIQIYSQSIPDLNITQRKDSLIVSADYETFQWFYEGALIPGADAHFLSVDNYGIFEVRVTDSLGCSNSALITIPKPPEESKSCDSVLIYPNPNPGKFLIELNGIVAKRMEVIDMLGHQVWFTTEDVGPGEYEVSLEDKLAEGVYFLYIQSEACEGMYKIGVTR